ncbi:unnamed protein product [Toxocara canis]|uniref:Sodium/potassium/calcium exchanger Nckx30C n=1 Tax=Toxocara canis TaxID=6265 RepID=A0A183UJ28_TOXCA|nr:unnamed protein product [Toxocara canis]
MESLHVCLFEKGAKSCEDLSKLQSITFEMLIPGRYQLSGCDARTQRRHGAILLHFCGLIYMFVALAIVCDEFFVPSLSVLTEAVNLYLFTMLIQLAISDDVAGATFMAAGGSAPEFFTSVFGVFITQNNVGIGTIVGSATFNILCVLAFCTLFSKEVLQLTWWPLFRDIFFYIFALLFLVAFFLDDRIEVHEALSMFIIYVIYAIIMKYNERLEIAVKVKLFRLSKVGAIERSVDTTTAACGSKQMSKESVTSLRMEHRKSVPVLRSGALFRSGIATLARESTLPEEDNDAWFDRQQFLENFAPNAVNTDTRRKAMANNAGQVAMNSIRNGDANDALANGRSVVAAKEERKGSTISNAEKPVDISWPPTTSGRFTYLCLAPIMLPLYVTLPDTKKPSSRRYFVVTFIGSIFWIALFSYLMVWWANTIGETLGIPTEIMGLTVLAAGTSIPDLITSVIVARKGLGDMAVSSSIGSNLFDICIGLPVPWLLHFSFGWLLYGAGDGVRAVSVSSKGLICSVSLLFLMLLVLVFAVAASGWRMNKRFGVIMILSYMLFCVISVLLEIGYMTCPLRTNAVCR